MINSFPCAALCSSIQYNGSKSQYMDFKWSGISSQQINYVCLYLAQSDSLGKDCLSFVCFHRMPL